MKSTAKQLSVGRVRFLRYERTDPHSAQRYNKLTECLVLFGGQRAGEYADYGDGSSVHMHVTNDAVWQALAAAYLGEDVLEKAIQTAIELAETERKLRERVRRDGKLVYRLCRDGRYTYHVREMNAFSNYVPGWIRFFQPSVEFYERNERGAWVWVAKSFYETQQEAVK